MAKLTVNSGAPPAAASPSADVVASATMEVVVTDDKGRPITLRRPGILAQYRIVEVIGDSAKNDVYMQMVLPLLYVGAIDGERVPSFAKKSELEALIQRLGEDGVAAVMNGVAEHFGRADPAADKAKLGN